MEIGDFVRFFLFIIPLKNKLLLKSQVAESFILSLLIQCRNLFMSSKFALYPSPVLISLNASHFHHQRISNSNTHLIKKKHLAKVCPKHRFYDVLRSAIQKNVSANVKVGIRYILLAHIIYIYNETIICLLLISVISSRCAY